MIPDCIATDDEDWEPPVWHAWDEWDQKVKKRSRGLKTGKMGVEAEILAQPKVHYFFTDFSFGKGNYLFSVLKFFEA